MTQQETYCKSVVQMISLIARNNVVSTTFHPPQTTDILWKKLPNHSVWGITLNPHNILILQKES